MSDRKDNAYHKKREVPIWERSLLTINEASDYTGIGVNTLRYLASTTHGLVIYIGTKKMFKKKKLDEYLENADSI